MRLSIVTPSFRNSQWLKLCIASVADQGVSAEHIVQDAGSDDGTLEWLPAERRVQAFVEQDHGMYDAINRGWRRAGGDILGHLNCDEQYLPGALRTVGAFFEANPQVEVMFGNAVVIDPDGRYLFHRKVQVPRKWHTWICPLSVLTCGTFFRRRLLDEMQLFFDTRWRIVGDSDWVLRMLQRGVRMATLGQFTSAFTHTSANLSLEARAATELAEFFGTAPGWLRQARPLILAHHRLRRVLGGVYSQGPFDYAVFTPESPDQRVTFHVARPTGRWRW